MLENPEEEIKKILPPKGPSVSEVKKYLKKYRDEYIVIKCGGSVLIKEELFNDFIRDISILSKLGLVPILIHGGGKKISTKLNESGIKSEFINGLRVTDKISMNIVEEVLNLFNKEIVESLKKNHCKSTSVTNNNNNVILVEQEDKKLGFVGNPVEIYDATAQILLALEFLKQPAVTIDEPEKMLAEAVANRKGKYIEIDSNKWSESQVVDALIQLDRFPLMIVISKDTPAPFFLETN